MEGCWNVVNRRVLYQQFADRGEEEEDDTSIPTPWMDADKAGLMELTNAPIEMANNLYGQFLATQKRDTKRAFQHMSSAEREAFLRRLAEINAANAKELTSNYHYILLFSSILCVLIQLFRH